MPYREDIYLTAMLTAYADNGELSKACNVFDKIPKRNVAAWNAMISSYAWDLKLLSESYEVSSTASRPLHPSRLEKRADFKEDSGLQALKATLTDEKTKGGLTETTNEKNDLLTTKMFECTKDTATVPFPTDAVVEHDIPSSVREKSLDIYFCNNLHDCAKRSIAWADPVAVAVPEMTPSIIKSGKTSFVKRH
ncbi:Pentatricopeptide repeat-containing protein [Platanthera zijinensis]|uniref:Pentatricopeptide repeat-containing protein n=1 Tax=Platanthera zijinensis TaxID=2320716 RepID=A0AAP0BRD4_9ASPA